MEHEQLRLAPDLLDVMRHSVTIARDRGAQFVAPAHVALALIDDVQVGPAIAEMLPRARLERAADDAADKLPEVFEVPEGPLPDRTPPPFRRYDTLAFLSRDGAATRYLDADAYHLFLEGARRATEVYRPKHLVMGFAAEAVKDADLLALLGTDPANILGAVAEL